MGGTLTASTLHGGEAQAPFLIRSSSDPTQLILWNNGKRKDRNVSIEKQIDRRIPGNEMLVEMKELAGCDRLWK